MIARRIAALAVLVTAGLCLAAPSSRAAAVSVRLQPAAPTVSVGDTFTVEVAVDPADSVFNAFDLFLEFDASRLEYVPTAPAAAQTGPLMVSACGNRFHLFTPNPGRLDITCSLLCNQVFVNGPGVIYRVRFRALPGAGATTLSLASPTRFFKAGFILVPLATQGMTVTVSNVSGIGDVTPLRFWLEPPFPNPCHAEAPASVAFQLPEAGMATLEVFDPAGRRVAMSPARFYTRGRHVLPLPGRGLRPGCYRLRLTDRHGHPSARAWVIIP